MTGTLEQSPLRRLLHQTPVAVLVLDVRERAVLHAGGLDVGDDVPGLPVPVAAWTRSARLTAPGGTPYADGEDPVSRAAAGLHVPGEPVWAPAGTGRRPLWATGFPLPASDDDEHALLVLFEVDGATPADDAEAVRDRAVIAAGLSFTISDPSLPDDPLVFVNPAFERTTGYTAAEVLGRNCRFLQSEQTDPAAVAEVRRALRDQEHAVVTLLNRRKDGTLFWNELSLSPVYDGDGRLTHRVGIQADVTDRVLAEQERQRHLAAERSARAAAERAQGRLALLAEATTVLAATLDVDEALTLLTHLAVPRLADWCTVHLRAADGTVGRVAAAHSDPDREHLLRRVEELQADGISARSHTARVMRGGAPVLLPHVEDALIDANVEDPALREVYKQLEMASVLVVPLRTSREVIGALSLFAQRGTGRTFDDDDLTTVADLGRRAALAVDNARLYSREHAVAEQLQRSLLPSLPEVAGLDRAARYLPGQTAARVGGDWYDLFVLPDGAVGVAIGDVMGHDLQAAAAMGQLRSVLRSYAWQGSGPATVLDHLDQLVQGLDMAQLATAVYARLELPRAGRAGRFHWANAGHLPPVLRRAGGETVLLDDVASLLVGAVLGVERDEGEIDVGPGDLLVLATDGLVERRGRDPDSALEQLRAAVAAAPDRSADEVCDALLAGLARGRDDDVALLVLRVL
ncbi:MAG: SpoIIE family protein phosphatase [Actinomycetota bacterium]|nr:SpoIIE family protein phosphatase [Actinomycetota bacterium]